MSRSSKRAVTLALTRELLESVAEEMAEVCVRTAVSSNIKERRDLSAAVFDGHGVMVAHAAHIPVHLGAMPLSVRAVLDRIPLESGDVALVNDPYAGGTHLPDITAVAPLFARGSRRPAFCTARGSVPPGPALRLSVTSPFTAMPLGSVDVWRLRFAV